MNFRHSIFPGTFLIEDYKPGSGFMVVDSASSLVPPITITVIQAKTHRNMNYRVTAIDDNILSIDEIEGDIPFHVGDPIGVFLNNDIIRDIFTTIYQISHNGVITGLIEEGSGVTIAGSGTSISPYIITASSGSIAHTNNILKGNNSGAAISATAGTDYLIPSDLSGLLIGSNNLSDLPDLTQSRLNLGLNTAAQHPATDFAPATGSVSIVTVGTISSGVWQGSPISAIYLGAGTPAGGKYLDGGGSWTTLPSITISVSSTNGFGGSVTTGTTPVITLTTSVTGLLKGNGTSISVATAGTDYLTPAGSYSDPSWLTSLSGSKISGTVGAATVAGSATTISGSIAELQVIGLVSDLAGKAIALSPTGVKTSNYSAQAGDLVPVNTTSGSVAITLPTAPTEGSPVAVKMVIQGGTNVVTINCGGSDVFNKAGGSTSATLSLLNQLIAFQYHSGIWYVVGDDLSLSQLDLRYSPLVGSTSFVTAGTITTGTWQGAPIAAAYLANTAVTPGSYTLANITVDAQGRLTAATSGSGIVTSISLATPNVLYATPITFSITSGAASGTLSLNTQSANTIFAGPTTGSAAAPTMRALVAADIPVLDASKVTTGTFLSALIPPALPVRTCPVTADTDGATITVNFATSDFHSVTLGGNRTIAFTGATVGQVVRIELIQDATGSRTITWPTVRWPSGTPPTLTTTATKADLIVIVVRGDGTYAGAVSIQGY